MNITMHKKTFSIIIPTYNSEKYIEECIESALSQSYQQFEIIVVDNNSTDSTVELINQFNSDKIKVFDIRNHGVIAASRNYGISRATGDYIAFLDSDDKWYANKLEVCAKYLEKHEFICHKMDGIHKKKTFFDGQALNFNRLFLRGNCVATSSVVMTKDIIDKFGGFSEERDLVTVEDYDLWLKLAWNGVNMYTMELFLGYYRKHDNNSSNYTSYSNGIASLMENWANRLPIPFVIARKFLLRYELRKMMEKSL